MLNNKPGNLTLRIIEVAKHSHPCHAGCHAGRFPAVDNEFDAKPAFFDVALFFDDPDIVGTGGNTIFAADAFVLVDQDHSVFPLVGSSGGADFHTGGIITMLTLDR